MNDFEENADIPVVVVSTIHAIHKSLRFSIVLLPVAMTKSVSFIGCQSWSLEID